MSKLFSDSTLEYFSQLKSLVFPIAFQQFMLALVSASDALMLGSLDQAALSAVSLAGQVAFVFNLFVMGFNGGGNVFMAQFWGKRDITAIEKIFGFLLTALVSISVCFTLAALLVPQLLMLVFTNVPELITLGCQYLRPVALSYLLTAISQICLLQLKNTGGAVQSMTISSTAVVANIVLNALLIYGLLGLPALGIAGAAIATVLSKVLELTLCVIVIHRRNLVHFRLRCTHHFDPDMLRGLLHYSSPVLANALAWGCGFTMVSVIMGHLGNDAVAANSIAVIVKNLSACFLYGISSGGAILVGNILGRGELELAKDYGRRTLRLAILVGAVTGGVICLLSPVILYFVVLTPTSAGYLRWMLVMCLYYMIGKAINSTCISGLFSVGGDARFGFLCDTLTMWAFVVPLGMLSAFVWKLPVIAVYFILNLDEMVKLPVVIHHFHSYKWANNLTEKTAANNNSHTAPQEAGA